MRTTLTIDDDVLTAAKALADQRDVPVGKVISELARNSLSRPKAARKRNGIPLIASRGGPPVTLDIVNALRDEAP